MKKLSKNIWWQYSCHCLLDACRLWQLSCHCPFEHTLVFNVRHLFKHVCFSVGAMQSVTLLVKSCKTWHNTQGHLASCTLDAWTFIVRLSAAHIAALEWWLLCRQVDSHRCDTDGIWNSRRFLHGMVPPTVSEHSWLQLAISCPWWRSWQQERRRGWREIAADSGCHLGELTCAECVHWRWRGQPDSKICAVAIFVISDWHCSSQCADRLDRPRQYDGYT